MLGTFAYDPGAASGEEAVLENHPRLTDESDYVASPSTSAQAEDRVDSTAPGSGTWAQRDRPSYPADDGLRRFVRRGLRVAGAAPVTWASGRMIEKANRGTGQGGYPVAQIEAAAADRAAPVLDPQAAPDMRPWYDTQGAFQ